MQAVIGNAINEALLKESITMDSDHRRRLVRVLIRAAARLAFDAGLPLGLFIAAAVEAAATEARTKHRAVVPGSTSQAKALN